MGRERTYAGKAFILKTMGEEKPSKSRIAYIDNLKALMIILVILVHAGCTYSGLGSWYYKEPGSYGNITFYTFLFFLLFTQAYFMALFFLISAYFIPTSLAKKGTARFLADRLFRLGVPTLIYMLILHPLLIKMIHPDMNVVQYWLTGFVSLKFLSWSGPMWFALTLLFFSMVYSLCSRWFTRLTAGLTCNPGTGNVLALTAIMALIAFCIRLVYPIGTSVMNLQFCFFAPYIVMFPAGILASQKNILDRIESREAGRWLIAAFAIGVPLWALVIHYGVRREDFSHSEILGGWNLPALGFALWESFICISVIIGLLGIFRKFFNQQSALQRFLANNAFGVYVFHPPILVAISLLLAGVTAPPLLKFLLVSAIAVPACFLASSLIRRIPVCSTLFS